MTIGKTYPSISKEELLQKFSETEILASVFPTITSLPCLTSSPFRIDKTPSFSIFLNRKGHVCFKDFGTMESGGLFDLLERYWNCSFQQVINKLYTLMVEEKPVNIECRATKSIVINNNNPSKIEVVVRPWKQYDYDYWQAYGVSKKWLKYAEIYPISYKIVYKKDSSGKERKYIFCADKYAYCFVERKEGVQIKIYQPFNTKGYKWCSKMDASVVGLWTKIPQQGDKVVICSSLKDALCISAQLKIPALCLQGEGYGISDTAINELKKRYKRIYISFDVDQPGIMNGKKLAEHTGFINVVPDLGKEKDFSDYYKSLKDKGEFKQLKQLFI